MFKPGGKEVYGRGVPPAHHVIWKRWTRNRPELDASNIDWDGFDAAADREDELMELSWAWLSWRGMHGQLG